MIENPLISIVLGSYNRRIFLKPTIQSIRENNITVPYEIIVVDGGSTDGSLPWLLKQKDIVTLVQHNRGIFQGKTITRRSWGYFMNLGFKCAQGKYILMISDDCLLTPGTVMNGLQHAENLRSQGQNIGGVAFYWRNWPDQQEYWVGLTYGKMHINHGLYLRQALEHVGWIEEERYQFYHADSDLSLKLWAAGYTIVDCPTAFVEHFVHANYQVRASNMQQRKADWNAYLERWSGTEGEHKGEWQTKEYDDPTQTVKRFPQLATYQLRYRRRFLPITRKVQRMVRKVLRV
jgi:GT2 family glycosyltransferase